MKPCVFLLAIFVFTSFPAYSADDTVVKAMKLYEKRHYEEASTALRGELHSLQQAQQGPANLALGMIYLKQAELYRELNQESLSAAQDYLRKLAAAKGAGRSRFVDLYMAEALLEAGKPAAAVVNLEKFMADEAIDARYRTIAKIDLGLCYYLTDDKQKADTAWSGIDAADPEVKAALASTFSRAGLKEKKSVMLVEEGLADVKKAGKTPSVRMINDALSVYVREGLTDKGLELLKRADAKGYSYREVIGKSKVITFYDLSLLGDLSALFGQAAVASLEKAAADAAVKDPAQYYLAQAYSLFGHVEQSAKTVSAFLASARMPQQSKDTMHVLQAANQYQKGRQSDALGAWDELSKKQPLNPELFAEIVSACAHAKAECPQLVKRAEAAAETGQGKKFYALNAAIGKYYLMKKNQAKAIAYMEAGRDKSNKNKFESNDPLMLVDLAGLYYRNKKFSEALEIYFELSKQFPAVRQIQEAMQGVYAIEQKSAGDVSIL